jgi:hypothetical protein
MNTERARACLCILSMPAALEHLALTQRPAPVPTACNLRRFLAAVPHPHDPRGLRHPLSALLASAAAVLAGARSLTAIGEWITDARGGCWACSGSRPIR